MAVLLVVEDDPGVRTSFARALEHGGHTVLEAASVFQGVQVGSTRRPDLLLLDLELPDGTGLDVLQALNKRFPGITAIVATGFGDIPSALTAGRLGVHQYLEKPVSLGILLAAVRTALARAGFGASGEDEPFDGILGTSAGIRAVRRQILDLGPTNHTVLIQGETGTWKELVARSLHLHSRRAERRFVPVNLGRTRAFALAALASCAAPLSLSAIQFGSPQQTTSQVFRGGTEIVVVNVVAVDSKGTPVRGLTADDFFVTIGGERRSIHALDFLEFGPLGLPRRLRRPGREPRQPR